MTGYEVSGCCCAGALVVDEPASSLAREWLAENERIVTWPAFLTGFRREESETPSRATARARRAPEAYFLLPHGGALWMVRRGARPRLIRRDRREEHA